MTVQELIDELQKIKDKDQTIVTTAGYRKVSENVYVDITEDYEYMYGSYICKAVKIDLCHD